MASNVAQGIFAESIFITKCLSRNIAINSPVADIHGYDFLLDMPSGFKKIQVKSVCRPCIKKHSYSVSICRGFDKRSYTKGDYDYVAAYLIQDDIWYIIPFDEIGERITIRIFPKSDKSKWNGYKEAFHLLK